METKNELYGAYTLWNTSDTKLYEIITNGNVDEVSKCLEDINKSNIVHVMFIIITMNNIELFKYILNNVSNKILDKENLLYTLIDYNKLEMLKVSLNKFKEKRCNVLLHKLLEYTKLYRPMLKHIPNYLKDKIIIKG